MEFDVASLAPVKNGRIKPAYENDFDVYSLQPAFKGVDLTGAMDAAKKTKYNPIGQIKNGVGASALNLTVGTIADTGDLVMDMNEAVRVQKVGDIKTKRAKQGYVGWQDPAWITDSLELGYDERKKTAPVEQNIFDNLRDWTDKAIQKYFPKKKGTANELTYDIAGGVTSTVGSIGAFRIAQLAQASRLSAALTPAAWFGASQAGQVSEDAEKAGVDINTRMRAFGQDFVANTAIEAVGLDYWGNALKGSRYLTRLSMNGLNNALQESFQRLTDAGVKTINGIPEEKWNVVRDQMLREGLIGLVTGVGVGAVDMAVQNKSLSADFLRAGFSPDQMNVVLDKVVSMPEMNVVGDLAGSLRESGFRKAEAEKAEALVSAYGGRLMFQKGIGKTVNAISEMSGLDKASSLIVAEELLKDAQTQAITNVKSFMAEEVKNMQNKEAFLTIMQDYVDVQKKAGKPANMSDEVWQTTVIANAYHVAERDVAEALRQGAENEEDIVGFSRGTPLDLKVGAEAEGEVLNQPVNKDVDMNKMVQVVDVTNNVGIKNSKDIRKKVESLIGRKLSTQDSNYFISVLPKNVRHITYSSLKGGPAYETTRMKAMESLAGLLRNSEMIETSTGKDGGIIHRFYVPIRIGDEIKTVRIVGKQNKDGLTFDNKDVSLYDTIIEKRNPPSAQNEEPVGSTPGSQKEGFRSKITIKQMLSGVKDDTGRTYFQSELGFFSKASQIIDEKVSGAVTKDQLIKTLKNNGVKDDEIVQLGLDAIDGKISKEDLQTLVKANQVPLEEKVLSEENANNSAEEIKNKLSAMGYSIDVEMGGDVVLLDEQGDMVDGDVLEKENPEAMRLANEYERINGVETYQSYGRPKFGQYQLPGGENYREVLLKMPTDQPATMMNDIKEVVETKDGEWVVKMQDGRKFVYPDAATGVEARNNFERDLQRGRIDVGTIDNKAIFRSSHFDDPNILVHARINDRIVDGKKVLFIEEIQSDWHQKGRKQGYGEKYQVGVREDENVWVVTRADGKFGDVGKNQAKTAEEAQKFADAHPEIYVYTSSKTGVPNAPFKKTWHELMFKRLLDKAVKEGYDAVAWTTGEQQQERYDLAKQIDSIEYEHFITGGKDHSFTIDVRKDGQSVVHKKDISASEAENILGKEMVKKMINDEGESAGDGISKLSGLDLKVGGEGMKGFYDQMLPSFVNKYTKKWGGKVGEVKISTQADGFMPFWSSANYYEKSIFIFQKDKIGEVVESFPLTDEGQKLADARVNELNKKLEKVNLLDITPAMRESIQSEGQPLFQSGDKPRGAYSVDKDTIYLFDNADASTFMHEMMHKWLKQTLDYVKSGNADDEYLRYWSNMKEWLGVTDDQTTFTTEQQEMAAKGFETYLMEGNSPTTALKEVFDAFRNYLLDIYGVRLASGQRINDKVRTFYSEMLGEQAMTYEDINADLESASEQYEAVSDLDEGLKAELEMTDDEAQAIFRAEQAQEQIKWMKRVNKYLKKKLPYSYVTERLHKDYVRSMLWLIGKDALSPDQWVSEFNQLFPEAGLQVDDNGKVELRDFDSWILSYANDMAGTIKEYKADIAEGRMVEKAIADRNKMAEKHMAKAMRKQKALKKISDKVQAGFKRGVAEGRRGRVDMSVVERKNDLIDRLRFRVHDVIRIKKEVTDYALQTLPKGMRDRAIPMIKGANTQDDLIRAFIRINEMSEKVERNAIIGDLRDIFDKITGSQSIDVGYKQKAKDLFKEIDLETRSKDTLNRIAAMKQAVDKMKQSWDPFTVTEDMADDLARLEKRGISELSNSQLQGLIEKLRVIYQVGRTKASTKKEVRQILKDRVIANLVAGTQAIESGKENAAVARHLTAQERFENILIRFHNKNQRVGLALTPVDVLMDQLDGGNATYNGINYRTFKSVIDHDYWKYLDRKDDIQLPILNLAKELKLDRINFERIGVYAVLQQESGAQKLASTLNEADYKRLIDMTLTPDEMKMYKAMRKVLDEMRPEISRVLYDEFNRTLDVVKNYFPYQTDFELLDEAEIQERMGQFADQYLENVRKKNTEMGFTKARVGGDQKIIVNAMDVFLRHTDNVVYFVSMTKNLRFLNEVAKSDEYKEVAGDRGQAFILNWLSLMARKGGVENAKKIAWLDAIRRNVGVGTLGLKASSILIQPMAIMEAVPSIGVKYVARGVESIAGKDWTEFVLKNMTEVRKRAGDDPAYQEFLDGRSGSDFIWLRKFQETGMKPIQMLDTWAAMTVAAGAYQKNLEDRGIAVDLTKPDQQALDYANLIVRRTQSSGQFKDAPLASSTGALSGNRSIDKALLQFQNFVINRASRVHEIKAHARRGEYGALAGYATWFSIVSLASVMMRYGLNALKNAITGDDKDYKVARSLMLEAFQAIPIAGSVIGSWLTNTEPNIPVPALNALDRGMSAGQRVVGGKKPETKTRGMIDAMAAGGQLAGVPGSLEVADIAKRLVPKNKSNKRVPLRRVKRRVIRKRF